MATLALARGLNSSMFGQQYPPKNSQQDSRHQNNPNDNGQYSRDSDYTPNGDPGYNNGDPGVYAPAPPLIPDYNYRRPPIPALGYHWTMAIRILSAGATPGSAVTG